MTIIYSSLTIFWDLVLYSGGRFVFIKINYYNIITLPGYIFAQYEEYLQKDPEPTMHKQAGVAVSVIESGTGIGGFYYLPMPGFWHLGLSANFFLLRDSKQIDYVDYTGYPITYGKENNAYLMDVLFMVKKRLFAREVADNLRPYLALSAGPIYGMNFPEDKSLRDEFGWTYTVAGAAGIEVLLERNYMFGIRLQYRYMKFSKKIGETDNHSSADVRLEIGKVF